MTPINSDVAQANQNAIAQKRDSGVSHSGGFFSDLFTAPTKESDEAHQRFALG